MAAGHGDAAFGDPAAMATWAHGEAELQAFAVRLRERSQALENARQSEPAADSQRVRSRRRGVKAPRLVSSSEFAGVYTLIYNMCSQAAPFRWSAKAYILHKKLCDEAFQALCEASLTAAAATEDQFYFYHQVQVAWRLYWPVANWFNKAFMSLDRVYVMEHQLPSLRSVASGLCFRKPVAHLLASAHAISSTMPPPEASVAPSMLGTPSPNDIPRIKYVSVVTSSAEVKAWLAKCWVRETVMALLQGTSRFDADGLFSGEMKCRAEESHEQACSGMPSILAHATSCSRQSPLLRLPPELLLCILLLPMESHRDVGRLRSLCSSTSAVLAGPASILLVASPHWHKDVLWADPPKPKPKPKEPQNQDQNQNNLRLSLPSTVLLSRPKPKPKSRPSQTQSCGYQKTGGGGDRRR
mmetsp:Transcript_4335/g.12918  ORF Transcript_4335/g.12918 Transcript_4335/m.12918 type:complete len:412 (-) Transcript_4335:309-1544(-)